MNKKIDLKYLVLGGIILILMSIIFSASFTNEKEIVKENKNEISISQQSAEKETLRNFFNVGCMEENATYTECNCMFNEIYNKLGSEKFIQESMYYNRTGSFSDEFINNVAPAIFSCIE